jgi:hypothetical protein
MNWEDNQMSVTTSADRSSERGYMILGTAMMLAWFMVIGVGGFLLLLGIFYAMVAENMTLAVVCCVLLFAPLGMTLLWGFSSAEALREKWAARVNVASTEFVQPVPEIASGDL